MILRGHFVVNWCYSWKTSCSPNSAGILAVALKPPVSALVPSLLAILHFAYSDLQYVSSSPRFPFGFIGSSILELVRLSTVAASS